jgi:hypothetical protein
MPRPKRKAEAVTVGAASAPTDRIKVQLVLTLGLLQDLRREAFRRAEQSPMAPPSVSDVACDLLRTGLARQPKRPDEGRSR